MAGHGSLPAPHPQAQLGNQLFFDAVVRGYVEQNPRRFVRRDWLAEELDGKLHEPGKRFVLLTAEPGAGKSAFMAQLAYNHPEWLRYFIRKDQSEVLSDVSSKSLLLRAGYQLSVRHPELFSPEQLRLSIVQRIGRVSEQAEVVGAEVKRLKASPFYQKLLEIEQQVREDQGKVVGLRVEELVVESRLLQAEDLLHLALIHPARALERTDPAKQIVILVDALDELRYHATPENILTWLTNCPELPENVRFVLTSRPPDEALNLFCEKQSPRLCQLTIAEEDPRVKQDVEQFINKVVSEPALAQVLAQITGGAEGFAGKVTRKAHGNMGYVDALARGVDSAFAAIEAQDEKARVAGRRALDALLALQDLPADLQGLYALFLHQIKQGVDGQQIVGKDASGKIYSTDVWPAVYEPILGVLAVAAEPLDVGLIATLGDIATDLKWVHPAVNRLRQFLDVTDGRYRFYHSTVAEFLTSNQTWENPETADLYQDAPRQHERIARVYKGAARLWAQVNFSNVNDYGLQHLAWHLSELARAKRNGNYVYQLICRNLLIAKRHRFKSDSRFVEDVRFSIAVAREQSPPDYHQMIRGLLIIASLNWFAGRIPSQAIAALAWAGRTHQAWSWAALRRDPWDYIDAAKASITQGDTSRGRQAIELAINHAHGTNVTAPLAAAVKLLYQMGDRVASGRVVADTLARPQSDGDFARALICLARACAQTGNLSPIRAAIDNIPNHRARALLRTEVAAVLLDVGKRGRAQTWLKKAIGEAGDDAEAVQARCAMAVVLARLGQSEVALDMAQAVDAGASVLDFGCEEHVAAELGSYDTALARAQREGSDRLFGYAIDAAIRTGALDQATDETRHWTSASAKNEAWSAIARASARRGQWRIAFDAVGAVGEAIVRLPAWGLAGKALARASSDNFEIAAAELNKRIDVAGSRSDQEAMMAALAYGYARQGHLDKAVALAEACIETCRIPVNRINVVRALIAIALCLATHGRAEARKIAAKAVRLANLADPRGHDREAPKIARSGATRVRKALATPRSKDGGFGERASRRRKEVGARVVAYANRDTSPDLDEIDMLVREGNTYLLQEVGAEAAVSLGADAVINAISALVDDFSRSRTLKVITGQLIKRKAWKEALTFSLARLGLEAESSARLGVFKALEADVLAFWAVDQGSTLISIADVVGELEDWWS
jgi:hypothetical protein